MRLLCFALAVLAIPSTTHAALISEFQPDPTGRDPSQRSFEIRGTPGMAFNGFVLGIGGEADRMGQVDTASPIAGTFDPNGLIVGTIGILLPPTHTVLLVDSFNGTAGGTGASDIDGDDDGIVDNISSFGMVFDAIGIDGSGIAGLSKLYGSQLGGEDFLYTGDNPRLIFREASDGNFFAINDNTADEGKIFDLSGQDVSGSMRFSGDPFSPSFGAINPRAVPEPSTLLGLTCLAFVAVARRRRRL